MAEAHTPYSLSDWLHYLSRGEVDLLNENARVLPPNPKVVNIGAGGGTSGMTFMVSRPDLFLTTIDPVADINPLGGLGNEYEMFLAAGLLDFNRYQPMQGESIKVADRFKDESLDLVFVDGNHSYEGAKGDIDCYVPKIKTGGYMAVHDYMKIDAYHRSFPEVEITQELIGSFIKPYPDVDRAVDERLKPFHKYIALVDSLVVYQIVR